MSPNGSSANFYRSHKAARNKSNWIPNCLLRSQPDQRDIRIVRGDYQLPFIFEHTSLSRPISLNAAAASDPKKPALSRWSLKLPQPSCRSRGWSARRPRHFFIGKCDCGKKSLTSAVTNLHPNSAVPHGTKRPTLQKAIWLSSSLRVLKAIRCFSKQITATTQQSSCATSAATTRVTRVVLKATSDPAQPLWLYYGNFDTSAPRYDLTLVAGELLKAERSTVNRRRGRKPFAETVVGWSNTNRINSLHFLGCAGAGGDRAASDHVALFAESPATMTSRFAATIATLLPVRIVFGSRNTRKDAKISVDRFVVDFLSCNSCVSWANKCEGKNSSNGLEVAHTWARIRSCHDLRTFAGPSDSFSDKGAD